MDVFLQPGEYFAGDAQHRVRTLLGSCVSVVLWSPHVRIGAMSHSLLPGRPQQDASGPMLDGRYGDEALRLMLEELVGLGVRPAHCRAKIFGGGDMFGARHPGPTVGQRNGEAAREQLRRCGIEVASESLYGDGHRQVVFDIATGEVWARQTPRSTRQLPVLPEFRIGRSA
ncbi:chemotaxis protein CheD [Ramlibacter sp. G-1-2-2]|uniref:Probable chemoreceptor glutamine deamidase CheD n=1 Tax=Ramlibacter agri TaxID=2728837 RepID=A0A848HDM3_9BURK|nr:chemotaxis protein CheD [Ramlibacter agri]